MREGAAGRQDIKTLPEEGFTAWDKIVIDKGDITVQELIDYFKSEHKVTCSAIGVQVRAGVASFALKLPRVAL